MISVANLQHGGYEGYQTCFVCSFTSETKSENRPRVIGVPSVPFSSPAEAETRNRLGISC